MRKSMDGQLMNDNPYESCQTAYEKPARQFGIFLSRATSYTVFFSGLITFALSVFVLAAFRVEQDSAYWILFVGPVLSAIAVLFCDCHWVKKILLAGAAFILFWISFLAVVGVLFACGLFYSPTV